MCVIRQHRKQTKRSYLNVPENYPWVFSEATATPESTGIVASTSASSIVSSPAVNNDTSTTSESARAVASTPSPSAVGSPMVNNVVSGLGIKSEHGAETDDEKNVASTTKRRNSSSSKRSRVPELGVKNQNSNGSDSHNKEKYVKEESDEESRFSEADERNTSDERNEGERREVKRRRLDPSPEAELQNSEFWSANGEHIEFTRRAFVTKSLFHLNSFVCGKKKKNQAFALFIREGVATPGFTPLPSTIDVDEIAGWSYSELRDALVRAGNGWGSSQTAMWLRNASVGSFVIMRHEYGRCRFCPARLKNENGKYIGPVYVIGIITKKVVPWSAEESDIADNKMGEFSKHHWPIHNVCRVSWRRMGYKNSLKEETQKYINHVCQPTLQRICDDFDKVFAGGATSESVRNDLWANATVPIRSEEFSDRFDHVRGKDE